MDNKHILIVDDERAILKGFQAILEMTGYRVSVAENGEEALDMACERFYNLALIDIKLPDMEGTELLRELNQINPEMKKVMVTGYASLENAIESVNLGAHGYLVKPVMPGILLEVVAEKLRDQEAEEERQAELVRELLKANKRGSYDRERWA